MADWFSIPNTSVDPDAPVTSNLMYALRDNPIAIAEGAAGAPRVLDAALSTVVTAAGRNWVSNRITSANWNFTGQTVMARYIGTVAVSPGGEVSGALLSPANAEGAISGAALPGQWRLQGYIGPVSGSPPAASVTSTWQRVS